MSKVIWHGVMITEYWFDCPAWLGFNWKFSDHGGGWFRAVKKGASLCSPSVCFFEILRLRKFRSPTKKIIKAPTLGWTPYIQVSKLLNPPDLDKMMREGIGCTSWFASSTLRRVCSPKDHRVALISETYAKWWAPSLPQRSHIHS
jgi:hypothetical protein